MTASSSQSARSSDACVAKTTVSAAKIAASAHTSDEDAEGRPSARASTTPGSRTASVATASRTAVTARIVPRVDDYTRAP